MKAWPLSGGVCAMRQTQSGCEGACTPSITQKGTTTRRMGGSHPGVQLARCVHCLPEQANQAVQQAGLPTLCLLLSKMPRLGFLLDLLMGFYALHSLLYTCCEMH
eukprot:1157627-Pelagomonas_calceolata.AAC.5